MNRSNANLKSKFLAVLSHLKSVHPNQNEITLKFTDPISMETFKLAAMNSLIAESHQFASLGNLGKRSDTYHRQNLEDELYQQQTSRRAAILCRNPLFWRYLEEILSVVLDEKVDELRAREYIYKVCNISHRRELDLSPISESNFHKLIEDSFLAWLSCY